MSRLANLLWSGLLLSGCAGAEHNHDASLDGEPSGDADQAQMDADGGNDGDQRLDGDEPDEGDADEDHDGDSSQDGSDSDGAHRARRVLTERALFGDMPLDNRVYDPTFTLIDGTGWSALGQGYYELGQVVRLFLPSTPTGGPALLLPAADNPENMTLMGAVKSSVGPISVSVWLGRPVGSEDENMAATSVSLLGMYLDRGRPDAIDLVADESEEPREQEGILWRRFVARLEEGPVGWSYLAVSSESGEDLLVSGPVVGVDRGETISPVARLSNVSGPRRALTVGEGNGLRTIQTLMGERLLRPRTAAPRPVRRTRF